MKNGVLSLLSILIIIVCSPDKLTAQVDLKEAYTIALSKIKKDKTSAKNKATLKLTLDQLVQNISARKGALIKIGRVVHLEQAILFNKEAQNYIMGAAKYLNGDYGDYRDLLKSLTEEKAKLKTDCAKGYFVEGESKFASARMNNDKSMGRAAFEAFQKAADYKYIEQDKLVELLLATFEFAQVTYGLDRDDYDPNFAGWEESNNQFIRILPLDQVDRSSCDCIITVDYETPVTTNSSDIKTYNYSQNASARSRTTTQPQYYTDKDGNKQKMVPINQNTQNNTATASVRRDEKLRICKSQAHVKIQARTKNCILKNKTWYDEITDSSVDVFVQGDRNTLPSNYEPSSDIKGMGTGSEMERQVYANLKVKVYQSIVPKK